MIYQSIHRSAFPGSIVVPLRRDKCRNEYGENCTAPRKRHLVQLKRIVGAGKVPQQMQFWFIRESQITAKSKATNVDWTYTSCGEVTDDIAADIPKPLGNPVAQTLLCRCEPAQRLSHGKKCHGYIC
mgnify:FL=1|jgi:hypothetical protein